MLQILVLFLSVLTTVRGKSCSYGDIRFGGVANARIGLVEMCGNKSDWHGVCGWSFGCDEAKVACRQGGFVDALSYNRRYQYQRIDTDFGPYSCVGTESSLLDCRPGYYWSNCDWRRISVECSELTETAACETNNAVRLVGGSSDSEGQLQICTNKHWRDVCSSSSYTANLGVVACRQLGYSNPYISAANDGRYHNVSNVARFYTRVNCYQSAYSTVSQCSLSSDCVQCKNQEVSVKCEHEKTDCQNGTLRLVGGPNVLEGILQICQNGIWGGVTDNIEGITKDFACESMGFNQTGATVIKYHSYKNPAHSPVLVEHINCCHDDKKIDDCDIKYVDRPIGSHKLLGLRCVDGCTSGEMRLVGGRTANEGIVQLCVSNAWTLVGLDRWDEADAQVVCQNMIGGKGKYVTYTAMNSSSFQKKLDRSIRYDRFLCHGSEKSLISCSKLTHFSIRDELAAAVSCGTCECGTDDSLARRRRRNTEDNEKDEDVHDKKANSQDTNTVVMATGIFLGGSVFGIASTMAILLLVKFFFRKTKS